MQNGGNNSSGQQAGASKSVNGGDDGVFSSKSSVAQSGDMKAPGQSGNISRKDFEANPSAYFSDLHKK
ncbi:hypothetical protein QQ045_019420 [Rhodiola kirilowii]